MALPTPRSSPRTTSWDCFPARPVRTRRLSTPPTGTTSASAFPTPRAIASTMERSTTARASPQLIEQARAFASGPRPQRSVVFMAVTAEEKGLLGSEYYAANPLYPVGANGRRDQHRRSRRAWAGEGFLHPRQPEVRAARYPGRGRRQRGRSYTPDPRPETGGFFRSDHFTMAKVGIPAMSFGPGQIW